MNQSIKSSICKALLKQKFSEASPCTKSQLLQPILLTTDVNALQMRQRVPDLGCHDVETAQTITQSEFVA